MKETEHRWSLAEIAEFMGYSYRYTRETIIAHPLFPKPETPGRRKNRFWNKSDVIRFYHSKG